MKNGTTCKENRLFWNVIVSNIMSWNTREKTCLKSEYRKLKWVWHRFQFLYILQKNRSLKLMYVIFNIDPDFLHMCCICHFFHFYPLMIYFLINYTDLKMVILIIIKKRNTNCKIFLRNILKFEYFWCSPFLIMICFEVCICVINIEFRFILGDAS